MGGVTRRLVGRDAGQPTASDRGLRGHGEAKVKQKERGEGASMAELVTPVPLALYRRPWRPLVAIRGGIDLIGSRLHRLVKGVPWYFTAFGEL